MLLARKGETPPGMVVIDTACNRSMVGELTLKADREDLLKNHGMDVRLVPSQESFEFRGGSHKGQDVLEKVIRPIGIKGHSGEANCSVIPGSDAPYLWAKLDTKALGMGLDQTDDTVRWQWLTGEKKIPVPSCSTGHYVDMNNWGPNGHCSPPSRAHKYLSKGIRGPNIVVYDDSTLTDTAHRINFELRGV